MKKICLLFCGGTIAMVPDTKTGALKPALSPNELYALAPKIEKYADVDIVFVTDIDSTNMSVKEWQAMASAIKERIDSYDAFVLTHGTDTIAETACALALAFGRSLKKPVIITGAQASPVLLGSDAVVNMERAILTAINTTLPKVIISFHDHAFLGVRTRKQSERKLAAFHSPAVPPLAEHMGDAIHWLTGMQPNVEPAAMYLPFFSQKVITVSLHAASDAKLLIDSLFAASIEKHIRGLVWVSLGSGNVPEVHHPAINSANEQNIPIIVVSQFPGGKLNMAAYDAGLKALKLGVIPAGDMTPEAAEVKLKWALGLAEKQIAEGKMSEKQIIPFAREVFGHNRADEITLAESNPLPV